MLILLLPLGGASALLREARELAPDATVHTGVRTSVLRSLDLKSRSHAQDTLGVRAERRSQCVQEAEHSPAVLLLLGHWVVRWRRGPGTQRDESARPNRPSCLGHRACSPRPSRARSLRCVCSWLCSDLPYVSRGLFSSLPSLLADNHHLLRPGTITTIGHPPPPIPPHLTTATSATASTYPTNHSLPSRPTTPPSVPKCQSTGFEVSHAGLVDTGILSENEV
eukprot:COSAG02_NODE_9941_length_2069_cov_2.152284_1_plen_222_part_10